MIMASWRAFKAEVHSKSEHLTVHRQQYADVNRVYQDGVSTFDLNLFVSLWAIFWEVCKKRGPASLNLEKDPVISVLI